VPGAREVIESLEHGIACIDTGYQRPGLAACYLVTDGGEAALIETGTAVSVPRILRALARCGVAPGAVRYVIPTHVHLDHAGGAGALLARLPGAMALAHPRGLRHLVEPGRLVQGATAIYGAARFARLYGEVVPVPASRILAAEDGSHWDLGGRRLLVRDTPGHARHHFCLWDERSRGWFTGDTFGVAYRELSCAAGPFLIPTTTPVQFDPAALHASIDRLMDQGPRRMYLTHYGAIEASPDAARQLHEQIDAYAAMADGIDPAAADARTRLGERLLRYTLARLRAAGCQWRDAPLARFLALDVELNADGLLHWRRARA
jgi:glyoxylase-like metal-dependent hydrolase (beta-lactamase superfamily II)